jgi:hypothetical protein
MNEITKAYTSYITLIAVIISLLYFFNALPHRLSKTSNYDVEENGSPHIVNESSSKRLTEFDHNSFKEFSEKLFPSEYAGIDIAGVPSILDLPDYQLYTKRHIFSKSIIESNVFQEKHMIKTSPFKVIDNIVNNMKTGHIVFNNPETINIKEQKEITLLMSLNKSMEELKSKLESDGTIIGSDIKVLSKMSALLTSNDLKIINNYPNIQLLDSSGITKWKWHVKPLKLGTAELHLVISALITVDGFTAEKVIKTYERKIVIDIKKSQIITDFLKAHWEWLIATLVLPLLLYYFRIYKNKQHR